MSDRTLRGDFFAEVGASAQASVRRAGYDISVALDVISEPTDLFEVASGYSLRLHAAILRAQVALLLGAASTLASVAGVAETVAESKESSCPASEIAPRASLSRAPSPTAPNRSSSAKRVASSGAATRKKKAVARRAL